MKFGEAIGHGREKTAYKDDEFEQRVIAVYHETLTPPEAKSALYLNHIAQILLPGEQISIRSAGVNHEGDAYMRSDFVEHDKHHSAIQDVFLGKRHKSDPDVQDSMSKLENRKVSDEVRTFAKRAHTFGIYVEEAAVNFIEKPNKKLVYVDCGPAFHGRKDANGNLTGELVWHINPAALQESIVALKDEDLRSRAQSAYDRIIALSEEFESTHKK